MEQTIFSDPSPPLTPVTLNDLNSLKADLDQENSLYRAYLEQDLILQKDLQQLQSDIDNLQVDLDRELNAMSHLKEEQKLGECIIKEQNITKEIAQLEKQREKINQEIEEIGKQCELLHIQIDESKEKLGQYDEGQIAEQKLLLVNELTDLEQQEKNLIEETHQKINKLKNLEDQIAQLSQNENSIRQQMDYLISKRELYRIHQENVTLLREKDIELRGENEVIKQLEEFYEYCSDTIQNNKEEMLRQCGLQKLQKQLQKLRDSQNQTNEKVKHARDEVEKFGLQIDQSQNNEKIRNLADSVKTIRSIIQQISSQGIDQRTYISPVEKEVQYAYKQRIGETCNKEAQKLIKYIQNQKIREKLKIQALNGSQVASQVYIVYQLQEIDMYSQKQKTQRLNNEKHSEFRDFLTNKIIDLQLEQVKIDDIIGEIVQSKKQFSNINDFEYRCLIQQSEKELQNFQNLQQSLNFDLKHHKILAITYLKEQYASEFEPLYAQLQEDLVSLSQNIKHLHLNLDGLRTYSQASLQKGLKKWQITQELRVLHERYNKVYSQSQCSDLSKTISQASQMLSDIPHKNISQSKIEEMLQNYKNLALLYQNYLNTQQKQAKQDFQEHQKLQNLQKQKNQQEQVIRELNIQKIKDKQRKLGIAISDVQHKLRDLQVDKDVKELQLKIQKIRSFKESIDELLENEDELTKEQIDDILKNQDEKISEVAKIKDKLLMKLKQQERMGQQMKEHESNVEYVKSLLETKIPNSVKDIALKLKEAQNLSDTIKKITDAMIDSPDYRAKRGWVEKIKENLAQSEIDYKNIKQRNQKYTDRIGDIQKLNDIDKQIQECQDLIKDFENLENDLENLVSTLKKLRFKLGMADIPDLIKQKKSQLLSFQQNLQTYDSDLQKSSSDLQNAHSESLPQINMLKRILSQITHDKGLLDLRLKNIIAKIEGADLLHANSSVIVPIIIELKEISALLTQRLTDFDNIQKQLVHIKTKYTSIQKQNQMKNLLDIILQCKLKLEGSRTLLEKQHQLCDEFNGYCSDEYENDIINRMMNLGDLRTVQIKLKQLSEANENFHDQMNLDQKFQSQITQNFEQEVRKHQNQVDEIQDKVKILKGKFDAIDGKSKLQKREREIDELEKRVNQIDIMIQKMLEEESEQEEIQCDNEKAKNELRGIRNEMLQMQESDIAKIAKLLSEARTQVFLASTSKELENSDLLLASKLLKKQLLSTLLPQVKILRTSFSDLRARYEASKLKLKTTPKYKPLLNDDVDRMVADWIFQNSCPVPIQRVGNGYYKFGEKKIYAKITNGKLVIRVGGGYMGIDEFMYYYGAQELNKMLAYEGLNIDEEIDLEKIIFQEQDNKNIIRQYDDGKTVIGSQGLKRRLSPSHQNQPSRSTFDNSGSPRHIDKKQLNYSPNRSQTPSVNSNMIKLRKSSQMLAGQSSPNSQQMMRNSTAAHTEQSAYQNKASTPLIRNNMIVPTSSITLTQPRRSPLQQKRGSPKNSGYLSVPGTKHQGTSEVDGLLNMPSEFGASYDEYLKMHQNSHNNRQVNTIEEQLGLKQQQVTSGSECESVKSENKSRVMELIKEKKQKMMMMAVKK